MDILAVSAELFPLVKTGGLADVAASLPKALKAFKSALSCRDTRRCWMHWRVERWSDHTMTFSV